MRDCPASVVKTLYRDKKEALQRATKVLRSKIGPK